ncbi:UbiA family prenyltransferase [Spirillospora sp. CA-255316]
MAVVPEHAVPSGAVARAGRRLWRETEVTWRLLADNVLACLVPPLVFALGACMRAQLTAPQIAVHLGLVLVLFGLYAYTFDVSNQARGAEEDRLNKPYRPIPAGLITPAGAMRRFWIAMPLYTALGWQLGVLEWVLLWQADLLLINLVFAPRFHVWWKTPGMLIGTVAQLAAAWQVVAPIDATVAVWLAAVAVPFVLALVFEDLRDMPGDRAIGRRTPALVLGEWPIRIWFATLVAAIPVLLHFLIYVPTGAPGWRIVLVDLIIAGMCWGAAVRAVLLRNTTADRRTYQLFIAAYAASLTAAPILWA